MSKKVKKDKKMSHEKSLKCYKINKNTLTNL